MSNDVELKVAVDPSGAVSGAETTDSALAGMGAHFAELQQIAEQFGIQLASALHEASAGAPRVGNELEGIVPHAQHAKQQLIELGERGEGALGKLQEKGGEVAKLLGGGLLAGGSLFVLDKVFESGLHASESMNTFRTSLLQAGVAQDQLAAKQKEGEEVVESLSKKYAVGKAELRETLAQMQAISGGSVEQAGKLTQISLAFEKMGIPAKQVRQAIAGMSEDGGKAIEALAGKVPGLHINLDGVSDGAGRLDAVLKGVQGTLHGMSDELDTPAGRMKRMKVTGEELEESVGSIAVSIASEFMPALSAVGDILQNDVIPVIDTTTKFIEDNEPAILSLVGAYAALQTAMAIKEAGGITQVLAKGTEKAYEFGAAILGKIIPGYAAKHAAEKEDQVLAQLAQKEQNEQLSAIERLSAAEQRRAIIAQRGSAAAAEAAAQEKLATLAQIPAAEEAAVATETEVGAQQGLNAAMRANPIGAIITGLGLLIGVFSLLYTNVKPVRDIVDEVWAQMKSFGATLLGLIGIHVDFSEHVHKAGDELREQAKAARDAGDTATAKALEAAAAQKELTGEVQRTIAGFNAEAKTVQDTVAYAEQQVGVQQHILRQNQEYLANQKDASAEQREAAKKNIDDAKKNISLLQESVGWKQNEALQDQKEVALGKDKVEHSQHLLSLEEQRGKTAEAQLKTQLLIADSGKLTKAHELELLELQKQNQQHVADQTKASERFAVGEVAHAQAIAKTAEEYEKVEEIQLKIDALQKQIEADLNKFYDEVEKATQAVLRLFAKQGDSPLLNLQQDAEYAEKTVQRVFKRLEDKPDLKPATDALNEFIDKTTGKLRDGVDPEAAIAKFSSVVKTLAPQFEKLKIDPKEILGAIGEAQKAVTAIEQEITKTTEDEAKRRDEAIKASYDDRQQIIDLYSQDEISKIIRTGKNQKQVYEEELTNAKLTYAKEIEAARAAGLTQDQIAAVEHASRKKLDDAERLLNKNLQKQELDDYKNYLAAKKNAQQEWMNDVKNIVGPGFEQVWSLVNDSWFKQIDAGLDASNNLFGAFADGVIKSVIKMGEEYVAQAVISSIASATASGATVAGMNAITAAAVPAATATSIASFGAADVAAASGMTATLASAEALFNAMQLREFGGITSTPTLNMTSENFQREWIMPERDMKQALKEEAHAARRVGGEHGISHEMLASAVAEGNRRSPGQTVADGYQLKIVHRRDTVRRISRGSRG